MDYIRYEREGDIGVLTIDRPQALNALNSDVIRQLLEQLRDIAASDLRCLIVTGGGDKAFVAGADIGEMQHLQPVEAAAFSGAGNTLMEALEDLPIPVIAAVNGYALGGGFELALACDIRVASEKAVFSFPETGLGIPPGYGGIQRASRLVGPAKAKELVFTGDRVKAQEALALGLVNAVVPHESLIDEAKAMALRIAANAPLAVRAAKGVANDAIGLTLREANRIESRQFGSCFATQDQQNAMTAFLEKRKPDPFVGR